MNSLRSLDHFLAVQLNQRVRHSGFLTWAVAGAAAWTASAEVVLMIALGLTGHARAAFRVLGAVGVVYVLVAAAGMRWRRARPFARLDAVEQLVGHHPARSFPSRHVASAFAMAEIAMPTSPAIGRLMRALAWVLAAARVGAGLHYPADVAAGALLGTLVGRVMRGRSH